MHILRGLDLDWDSAGPIANVTKRGGAYQLPSVVSSPACLRNLCVLRLLMANPDSCCKANLAPIRITTEWWVKEEKRCLVLSSGGDARATGITFRQASEKTSHSSIQTSHSSIKGGQDHYGKGRIGVFLVAPIRYSAAHDDTDCQDCQPCREAMSVYPVRS